ncbi:MAG TPA: PD-(D/E)XK nuclease family protein [Chroococcidiopsis sp.]
MITLSQGQLNLLETCPRKFQHICLDQLMSPPTPEQQERLLWGNRFHLLMQQHEMGLAIATLFADDRDPLQQSVATFTRTVPDLFAADDATHRQSEHRRTLEFHGYVLTVVYDLLILEPHSAQILDWKTYPRPQTRHWLAENWQTRLYPFVLAETSEYAPEQIAMTYWFVQPDADDADQPQSMRFDYSAAQYESDRHTLTQRLDQLSQWLEDYTQGGAFPQVAAATGRCQSCSFAVRCQRHSEPQSSLAEDALDLDSIPEVQL